MDRALLILDLDETIVRATLEEPAGGFDFRATAYFVKKRPHLDRFLETVGMWYDLAVWTSSGATYAHQVVECALGGSSGLRFSWSRSRCTDRFDPETGETHSAKNLKKIKRLGFDLNRALILDDTPEKVRQNYGNHIRLKPFEGQADDRELLEVLPLLEWLKDQENFRGIEKRNWRGRSA